MKVHTGSPMNDRISVGDILQFKHTGTGGEHGFYLICKDESKGYFIMNLSGKKSRISYYESLSLILRNHENSIKKIFPASEYQIKLERLQEGAQ